MSFYIETSLITLKKNIESENSDILLLVDQFWTKYYKNILNIYSLLVHLCKIDLS